MRDTAGGRRSAQTHYSPELFFPKLLNLFDIMVCSACLIKTCLFNVVNPLHAGYRKKTAAKFQNHIGEANGGDEG